jgi:hypothetical protein
MVKALKTPEARGGRAHLAPNACRTPNHRVESGEEGVYTIGKG